MGSDDLDIHVRLKGARAAGTDMKHLRAEIVGVGTAEDKAAAGARRWGRSAGQAEKRSRGLGKGFIYARKSIGPLRAGVTGLTGALGFGAGVGLIGALGTMKDEARDAVLTNRATAAVLKSTGGAANVSKRQVYDYATSLSKLSGIDNQIIQKGENMLLTFRDIRNEQGKGNKILDRSTKAALNLSAAFKAAGKEMSPTDAALQLGKAINDPVKGMGRLQRIGVTFTDQQVKQVTAMTKANNTLGAQKVILRELNKEFGGAAKSQADPLQKLDNAYHNIAETIGLKLLPYVNKGAATLTKFINQVVKGTGAGGRFRDKVEEIWKAAKPVVLWFGKAAAAVFKFAAAHPDLVKVATALFLVSKALRIMRFGRVLSGLSQIANTKAGQALVANIVGSNGIGGLAGKMKGPLASLKKFGVGKFGLIGKAFGIAAAVGFGIWLGKQLGDATINALVNIGKQDSPAGAAARAVLGADPRVDVVVDKPSQKIYSLPPKYQGGLAPGDKFGSPYSHHGGKSRPGHPIGGKIIAPAGPMMTPAPVGVVAGDTVHHTVVQIGDRVVWESWDRHDRKKKARR